MDASVRADLEHNKGIGLTGKWGLLGGTATGLGLPLTAVGMNDLRDNDDEQGAAAEAIAQVDLQVPAAHIGGLIY